MERDLSYYSKLDTIKLAVDSAVLVLQTENANDIAKAHANVLIAESMSKLTGKVETMNIDQDEQ